MESNLRMYWKLTVRFIIVQCITNRHIEYVKDAKSAFEMICLKNVFERNSILSKLYVRRQLLSLKCKMGTDLEEHFQQFDRLI
ncbi:hypothetical protein PR048_013088 [Dryococelus australis]|uniref:Retrovirus-related Pol polyprotein from transposon TNT 1-94 n=1 Tax=Dryococelus australis TaxID=614101 RepID=A0ABQ9HR78_9NEOP|nr:hypothetical protein PR048_013088 [Dryococelus australis]